MAAEWYSTFVAVELLVTLSLTSIFALVVKRRWFSPISDIPGPFLASFSHLWQIIHTFKGHTEEETIALHKKHGDFVRISHNEVSIGHPDGIRDVLKSHMNKGGWYKIFSLPDGRYVNPMSECDYKSHVAKTKNLASGYAFSNVIKSEPYIDQLLNLMEERLDGLSKTGKSVNFDEWFNFLGFDILGEVTFSKSFGFIKEGRDIGNAIYNSSILGVYVAVMGHFVWAHDYLLANPLIHKFNLQPSMHVFDTCLSAVAARSNNDAVRKDMMEQWMDTRKKHPERMAEKEVLCGAVVNIGAGADTISTTLQTFFYYLLRDPKSMTRLRAEIDAANLSSPPTYEETQKLPFLQACLKETYRYHPAVGFGLPRVTPKGGVTILGRHFPEGVTLSVNPWVIHRRPDLFGPDADVFRPDRWMDADRAREMDKYILTFGAGYNQCPGRHLAHLEVSKTTAMLVKDYTIRQVEEGKSWRFETHFTAVPYGWPCWVERRKKEPLD